MRILSLLLVLLVPLSLFGQAPKTPAPKAPAKAAPPKPPDEATLKKIEEGTEKLKAALKEVLPPIPPPHRADLEVYLKAAEWIVRHQEWLTNDAGKQTLAVIDQGLKRIESTRGGKLPWLEPAGKVVPRAYRSRVDGSIQPYAVWYPAAYAQDVKKKWRIDLFLHGRDGTLTEVKFLNQHQGKATPADNDFVLIEVYGRGNNAYRWSGENDIEEALLDFLLAEGTQNRLLHLDLDHTVLKGFSMGGAGTWHYGLRRPDKFEVIQPGAGFTTTHGYIAKLPEKLPPHQEACLKIYDALGYAENAAMVPIVAYSGEIDKQRLAATNIEERLKALGMSDRMTHLIGPGLEHKFPPEWQKKAEVEIQKQLKKVEMPRKQIRFKTYTLHNAECNWIKITGLDQSYQEATIDAIWKDGNYDLTTKNISHLTIENGAEKSRPSEVTVNGKKVKVAAGKAGEPIYLEKKGADWVSPAAQEKVIRKTPEVCGPIDLAFTRPFLCVVGTGKPLHYKMHQASVAQLQLFQKEWDKFLRGQLTVKKDSEVNERDIQDFNLILFGDPSSNSLIKKYLPSLPLTWTAEKVSIGGQTYDAATHLPMLIHPNPQQLGRAIVINSGHTFHAADFNGTNALLYARLGDYAIVQPTPTGKDPTAIEVKEAGLFDEKWKVKK
jgi:pimeloyl-ACP methyl ester carboxylesterase